MKPFSKTIAGLVAASMLSVPFAAPADAQRYRRYRGNGIDAGDVITGVAIIGGIAAIAAALSRDGSQRRYRDSYEYRGARDDYSNAVNNCGREAEQQQRGNVRVTDVNRTGNDRYLVRGVIESRGYDYDNRYRDDRYYDRDYDRDDRYYDRDDRYEDRDDRYYDGRYRGDQLSFTCVAWGNGRISDFEVARY